jgi:hypothetical protein
MLKSTIMKSLRVLSIVSVLLFLLSSCSSSRNTTDASGRKKTKVTGLRPNVRTPSTGVINATGDNLTPGINSVNRNGAGSEENAATIANAAISRANSGINSSKTVADVPAIEKQLLGKWRYTSRGGGFAGKKETADPSAPTIIEFKPGFNFIKTTSGQVTEKGSYEIIKVRSIYSGREENAVRFNEKADRPQMAHIVVVKDDSLTLADNVYDGFTTIYSRLK